MNKEKIYVLCEEFEDDGIREFSVLEVSRNKQTLQIAMEEIIKKDEYDIIADNGIYQKSSDYFETNNIDGFVCYYIVEREIV